MDFLQTLRAHVGGLIRLKSQLFWYDGRGFDDSPGRICLLLDAGHADAAGAAATRAAATEPAAPAALLLIDDRPQWIWVAKADVELIT